MHSTRNRPHPTSVEGFVFLLGSVLLAVYSLVLHELSKAKWKMSPYLFPLLLAVFLFLLSLSLLQEGRKERKAQEQQEANLKPQLADESLVLGGPGITHKPNGRSIVALLKGMNGNDALVFALITLAYIFSITMTGFVISTFLFLVVSFVYLKERRKVLVMVLSISFPLVVYLLFGVLLHVMLP
ncbi:MAG: hypothetical protein EOM68_09310 [Spirochaetia bacterium]|nr:hypothetical protein [Spirochaetia bacterium]